MKWRFRLISKLLPLPDALMIFDLYVKAGMKRFQPNWRLSWSGRASNVSLDALINDGMKLSFRLWWQFYMLAKFHWVTFSVMVVEWKTYCCVVLERRSGSIMENKREYPPFDECVCHVVTTGTERLRSSLTAKGFSCTQHHWLWLCVCGSVGLCVCTRVCLYWLFVSSFGCGLQRVLTLPSPLTDNRCSRIIPPPPLHLRVCLCTFMARMQKLVPVWAVLGKWGNSHMFKGLFEG